MAGRSPIVNAILAGSRRRGLDPNAVLAVAGVEGLGGGVGDQGTSFGPFQLHIGGALPRGIRNPQQWANSPAGVEYALNQIARVAGGRRGRAAVEAIVRGFERPADPGGEISRALARYGRVGGGAVVSGGPAYAAGGPVAPTRNAQALALISQGNAMFGLDPLPLGLDMQPTQIRRASAQTPLAGNVRPTPRRSGKTIKFLEAFASPFGVQITSTTSGKHVKGSYHYKGRAVDFGGGPKQMSQLAHAAALHPQDFTEMFYTGPGNPGYFIKNGRLFPNSELDRRLAAEHTNHVHLAR